MSSESGRPTRKKVDLSGQTVYEEKADAVVARVDELGLSATGTTKEEAWEALVSAVRELMGSDDTRDRWIAFAEKHSVEEEIPEEELAEQRAMVEASHAASAGFEVLSADELPDALARGGALLVDLWAEWCMPCHMVAPVLKEVADELGERLAVAKIDMDANKELYEQFGVQGIPTMILFVEGTERHRVVGAGRSKADTLAELEPHLP